MRAASSVRQGARIRRRVRIDVRGAVQGVGFRPFIYNWAQKLGLVGWVENTAAGVRLEVEGEPDKITTLLRTIRRMPPPNASVSAVDVRGVETCGGDGFCIRDSAIGGLRTAQILPDLATCEACLTELFDPSDRRYRYPFINCTHCGPRFSIIEDLPYDRARTTMRHFPMCPACRAEYEDPSDRRFHAEPNACPDCGPHLTLHNAQNAVLAEGDGALSAAAQAIRAGGIVAVKGIGGFHLMADARNEAAVALLRLRKQRPDKPFAVMFPSIAEIERACTILPVEAALLASPAHPIVLIRRQTCAIAASVAPDNPRLGAMLPYAPLHHVLMRELGFAVVATSGNCSGEPILTDEVEARVRLESVADLFLVHNRVIVRPVDDSVLCLIGGREVMLRRARGYAPAPVADGVPVAGILALGGHLKTTVAVTGQDSVILGQHLGDLETVAARAAHVCAVRDILALHGVSPRLVVRDLHPDYATSRVADRFGVPVLGVQHHLAHVMSCMAEHGIAPPVLGVAWDGTGYGPDGTIWGGEFLLIKERSWCRAGHLRTFPLPGGVSALREPRRAALGLLHEAFGADAFAMDRLPPVAALTHSERDAMRIMLARNVNSPRTSSMGRLFDAFAALCGLCQQMSYEGQAAMALEWAADAAPAQAPYTFVLRAQIEGVPWIMDWQPALELALADLRNGTQVGAVSSAFHAGLAAAIAAAAGLVGEQRVVLTGGCFQNAYLTEAAIASLCAAGHEPIWHRRVPPNDGGIALGQALWASWDQRTGERPCV